MPESKRFLELIEQMRDIHKRKNAGYAGKDTDDPWANFRMSNMLGVSPFKGCLVRMSDKFIRVANLSKDEENDQVGEPITDTLLDLACYSLIAICLYEDANKESVNINIEFDAESLAEKLTEAELHIPKDVKAEHGFPDLVAVRGRPLSPEFVERLSKAMDQYEKEEEEAGNKTFKEQTAEIFEEVLKTRQEMTEDEKLETSLGAVKEEAEAKVKSDHSSKVAQAVEALKSLQDYNKRARTMKVYLSGGMHSTWQDYFIKHYPEIEFFDPRSNGLTDPMDYTKWDMFHIQQCDAVIAYLSKENPSGVGLAFEIGYALGIGKTVYFANEKEDKYFAIVTHAVAQHLSSENRMGSIHFDSLEEMITHFIIRGGIPKKEWYT